MPPLENSEDEAEPAVTETLEETGLNDYVDHDVDFAPVPNPANATRPDEPLTVPATPMRSVRPRLGSPKSDDGIAEQQAALTTPVEPEQVTATAQLPDSTRWKSLLEHHR